jgi:hypothetical protein
MSHRHPIDWRSRAGRLAASRGKSGPRSEPKEKMKRQSFFSRMISMGTAGSDAARLS